MKVPGPDHPISIARNQKRVRVSFAGTVIADTTQALTLKEASYPAVHYIPRADANMNLLKPTAQHQPLPVQRRRQLFLDRGRRPHGGKRGVELRAAVSGDGGDQGLSGVLSEPRCDRAIDRCERRSADQR